MGYRRQFSVAELILLIVIVALMIKYVVIPEAF